MVGYLPVSAHTWINPNFAVALQVTAAGLAKAAVYTATLLIPLASATWFP